jgi:preprotein translocase subunit SecB
MRRNDLAVRGIKGRRHAYLSGNHSIMSDENNQPFFNIQRIYLKDMSLEQPNSPGIFLEQEMPSVEVEVDVKAERLADSVFEILVTGTVTAKVSDKVAFLIEAKQAGIFDIRNIPAEQIDPLVGIACPTILFPYLRSNIADAITRAGFPPIHLAEINFQALYEQRLAQMGGQDGASQNGVTH